MPGLSLIWCAWLISAFSAYPPPKAKKRVMGIYNPPPYPSQPPSIFYQVYRPWYTPLVLVSPSWLPHRYTFQR